MACSPTTFHGINEGVFKGLRTDLTKFGLSIPMAHEGMITGSGIAAEFKWDEPKGELWVHLQKKPFIVSCGFIYDKLRESILSNGGT